MILLLFARYVIAFISRLNLWISILQPTSLFCFLEELTAFSSISYRLEHFRLVAPLKRDQFCEIS